MIAPVGMNQDPYSNNNASYNHINAPVDDSEKNQGLAVKETEKISESASAKAQLQKPADEPKPAAVSTDGDTVDVTGGAAVNPINIAVAAQQATENFNTTE